MVSVITHNGSFHCDEVLAFAMIRYLYGTVHLTRTRSLPNNIDDDTFVVDVGGVFDPSKRRYDHHQHGFSEVYNEKSTVPLSSAGLVYKYHGHDILDMFITINYPTLSIDVMSLKDKVYDGWIKHIDANDNGVTPGMTKFSILSTIYARVGRMNVRWNQENTAGAEMEAFLRAADMVISEFLDFVDGTITDYYLTEVVIEEAIIKNPSSVLSLDQKCPWKGHIFRLEKKYGRFYMFIIYPSDDGSWKLHAIPAGPFTNRYVIPTHFRGSPGVTFIHNAGFIASAVSYDAASNLAQLCIEYYATAEM